MRFTYPGISSNKELTNGISVSGVGVAKVQPDTLTLYFNVQEKGDSTQEAQQKIDELSKNFIELVKGLGVEAKSIQTSNYSVYQNYYWEKDTSQQIADGYNASQTITITLNGERFIELGEQVLSAAPTVGNININGSNFSLKDKSAGEAQVRELALEQARKKAEQLANAAGVTLGDPINIVESSNIGGFYPMYNTAASVAEEAKYDSVSLEAGESEVSITVNVVYEIK